MDRVTLYFLLTIPLYFGLLHLLILPILQRVSLRIQGVKFTHRLQAGAPSDTKPPYGKFDLVWSFLANMLALTLSFLPLFIFDR
jgi:hypothetical protein